MDQMPGALLLTTIVLVLAACAAAPSVSPNARVPFTELPHEAPELEAVLPDSVQGRPIATWSMADISWPAFAAGESPEVVRKMINEDVAATGGEPVDFENLALAIGGRSNPDEDPPYFVWAAKRPIAEAEIELTTVMMFGAAGFTRPFAAGNLDLYDVRVIGGKTVHVGSADMVDQNDHQRGIPYLYENDDYMFLVLSEDPAWAEEALAGLP
jgi:hypothetical protein